MSQMSSQVACGNSFTWPCHLPSLKQNTTVIRLTETISVHLFGRTETGKTDGPSKNVENSKTQIIIIIIIIIMKRAKQALPEEIPPRICVTLRRATFRSRSKNWKIQPSGERAENMVNTRPGSHDDFSGNV